MLSPPFGHIPLLHVRSRCPQFRSGSLAYLPVQVSGSISLGVPERTFCSNRRPDGQILKLDREKEVTIEPDLMWWDGPKSLFVGDAKYKNVTDRKAPNTYLYQMLSYIMAFDFPGGLLVYAKGDADKASYTVQNCGRRLEITLLDLSGSLEEALASAGSVANRVMEFRDEARAGFHTQAALTATA